MKPTNKNVEKVSRDYAHTLTTPRNEIVQRIDNGEIPKKSEGLPVNYEFPITFDDDGNVLYKGKPSLRGCDIVSQAMCNLAGAYPYLVDVMSFVLTHYPDFVGDSKDYYTIEMDWQMFIDLALDGMPNQTQYLIKDLQKILKKIPAKAIAFDKEILIAPLMFVLMKHTEAATQGLDNKGQKALLEKNKKDATDSITIYALKGIFKGVKEGKGVIDFPKSFYAKVVNAAKNITIKKEPISKLVFNGVKSVCNGQGIQFSNIDPENLESFTLTPEMLYKATLYLRLHDNGERQMHVPSIKSGEDGRHFLRHVAPRYIETKTEKERDDNGKLQEILKYRNGGKRALKYIAAGLVELSKNENIKNREGYNPLNLITSIKIDKNDRLVVTYGNRDKK